jgi:hypothetical protein
VLSAWSRRHNVARREHCPNRSPWAELEHARRVGDVVRLGRATSIEYRRLVLERVERAAPPDTLYVDCTASALAKIVGVTRPVFEPGHIALQMIRLCQPTFSTALIGHIEVTVTDADDKQRLTGAVPMPDTVVDWAHSMVVSLTNECAWARHMDVRLWLANCRLNASAAWGQIPVEEVDSREFVTRLATHMKPAIANLRRLSSVAPLAELA